MKTFDLIIVFGGIFMSVFGLVGIGSLFKNIGTQKRQKKMVKRCMISMKKLIAILIFVLTLMSCEISKIGVVEKLLLPTPPQTPVLKSPQCLMESDRRLLAQFYRDYDKYIAKMEVFKMEVL